MFIPPVVGSVSSTYTFFVFLGAGFALAFGFCAFFDLVAFYFGFDFVATFVFVLGLDFVNTLGLALVFLVVFGPVIYPSI